MTRSCSRKSCDTSRPAAHSRGDKPADDGRVVAQRRPRSIGGDLFADRRRADGDAVSGNDRSKSCMEAGTGVAA